MRIAQRFSVGWRVYHSLVPEGRLNPSEHSSAVPFGTTAWAIDPNAEALGYCRMSLRDKRVPSNGETISHSKPSGIERGPVCACFRKLKAALAFLSVIAARCESARAGSKPSGPPSGCCIW